MKTVKEEMKEYGELSIVIENQQKTRKDGEIENELSVLVTSSPWSPTIARIAASGKWEQHALTHLVYSDSRLLIILMKNH